MDREGWCDYFNAAKELLWTRKFTARNAQDAIAGCERNLKYRGATDGVVYWGGKLIARINK